MQNAEGIAHDPPQLIFISGIHDRDALGITIGSGLSMMVNSAQHDHVTAYSCSFALNHRSANRGHVAIDGAFNNHIAAKSYRAFLYRSGNANRLAHSENSAVDHALDHARLWVAGVFFICRLPGDS